MAAFLSGAMNLFPRTEGVEKRSKSQDLLLNFCNYNSHAF